MTAVALAPARSTRPLVQSVAGLVAAPLDYRPSPDVVLIAITCENTAGEEQLAVMQFVTCEYYSPRGWIQAQGWFRRLSYGFRAAAALRLAGTVRRLLGSGSALPARTVALAVREAHWLMEPHPRWTREPTREAVALEVGRSMAQRALVDNVYPVRWRPVERADLPGDRTYRNAWRDDGTTVYVDMVAARQIHRDLIRRARAPRLYDLDVAFQRGLETLNRSGVATVTEQKRVLRDLPADPAIEAASTPAELRATWPVDLLGPMPV